MTLLLLACAAPDAVDSAPSAGDSAADTTPIHTIDDTAVTETSGTTTPPDDTALTDSGTTETDSFPPPALDDCITDGTPGHHVYTCNDHVFDLELPAACLDAPCGLILDVHGMTMDATMQDANTGLRALGTAHGYVVVQPTAPGDPPFTYWDDGDDDAVWDFFERTVAAFHLDPARLHVTGFSQGGSMSWRLLCAHSDVLASVAPAAGCDVPLVPECAFEDGEAPAHPIPTLYMHGTEDNIVAFDCAPERIEAAVATWGLGTETVVSQDGEHLWRRWTGATTLEFVQHDYRARSDLLGGHCFPGSEDLDGGADGQLFGFGCDGTTAFDWGEAVMAFFAAHPKADAR